MEDIKQQDTLGGDFKQHEVPPQHFSPVTTTTSIVEIPPSRQTVLMWGSNARSPSDYHTPTVTGETCDMGGNTECGKWGERGEANNKVDGQNGEPESPHHHPSHHNHHNSRVVMVL